MLDTILEDHVATSEAEGSPVLRIAVATREGQRVDLHFGHAEAFFVYDVDASGPRLVEKRIVSEHALNEEEDPRATIYRMVADCKTMLLAKIGAAPQEALAALGVEASNMHAGKGVEAALREVYAAKMEAAEAAPLDASEFQLLHAMLRVADLDRSVAFYTERLGMKVLERREHKKNQFSQAYLGYGDGAGMQIELVSNWQRETPYEAGDAFGHIAIAVKNIQRLCDRLAAAGVPLPRAPRGQRHGENIVAFIQDPDGHRIELIQTPQPE
jgi:lactoylglutathione lyase